MAKRHDAGEATGQRHVFKCGFCTSGRTAGRCGDWSHRCKGVYRNVVPKTDANPAGELMCACAANGHRPVRTGMELELAA